MKNKPWKEWKTRKATLIFSVLCICVYTAVGIVMGFLDHSLDSTLTEQVFNFFKWLVVTGCAITVSKVIKGKTNSDCDECLSDEEDLDSEEETEIINEEVSDFEEDLNYKEETNSYKDISHEIKGEAIDIDNETTDNVVGRKI